MDFILTIIRERQFLAVNPPVKVVVDGKAQYALENGGTLRIPLSPDMHTIDFSAMLRKKSMVLQVTEDATLAMRWNQLTGGIDVTAASAAERSREVPGEDLGEDSAGDVPQPMISAETKEAIRGGVQSAQKSLKGLWGTIKAEALKARQDAAVKAAYKQEEEKRKPRIEKIEHRREFTPQEQQTIDMAELEIQKLFQDWASSKFTLGEYSARKSAYKLKIDEIKSRAVWYETIEYPPEIDPSVPIEIDEEAIRNSIK